MAPSGPRNQRNTRNTSGTTKPGGRGPAGIKKRGAGGPTRVDRDGDLDMGTSGAANGAGKASRQPKGTSVPTGPRHTTRSTTAGGRAPKPTSRAAEMVKKIVDNGTGNVSQRIAAGIDTSNRHTRSSRPINAANTLTLRVGGLKASRAASNDGGGLRELLVFLERKAVTVGKLNRSVRIKKSHMKGDFVYITASKEDAEEIKKLNLFEFAGAKISIEELTEETTPVLSEQSQSVKEQLTAFLGQRYKAADKLLDLSNLGQDPNLQQMGMLNAATPEKLFKALMAILEDNYRTAQAKREGIISVSLAGNNIDDVQQIMSLADTFPDLLHLELSHNQFKEVKALRKWSNRLRKLETLYLTENPINTDPSYITEFVKWWPRLQNVNGNQVRTKEEVEAAEKAPKVFPVPQYGTDFRDVNQIGEGFITDFYNLYDADRQTLATKYYDEQSTFSYSVMTNTSHIPNTPSLSWSAYIRVSRNLVKITHPPSRQQRLFVGTNSIQSVWSKLPATRHPPLSAGYEKYLIDCHPMNGLADPTGQILAGVEGMTITMHGEFEDQDPETKVTATRSFSRTFVIGPGFPGRHPIRVISDLLQLRAYAPLPPQTGPQPSVTEAVVDAEAAQKQQMTLELCKQTGMNIEYSKMCLETASWNFDEALKTFNERKGVLPAEAWAVNIV